MSDPRPARPKRVAGVSGDDATYYFEEHESGWRVTYDDAPIGLLKDAGDATRFACDIARMQAQIGRVTWVIVLAEVEEVHRFETRTGSIQPSIDHEGRPSGARPADSAGRCSRFLDKSFGKFGIASRMALRMKESVNSGSRAEATRIVNTPAHSGPPARRARKNLFGFVITL
jgi:hypothetical protein